MSRPTPPPPSERGRAPWLPPRPAPPRGLHLGSRAPEVWLARDRGPEPTFTTLGETPAGAALAALRERLAPQGRP